MTHQLSQILTLREQVALGRLSQHYLGQWNFYEDDLAYVSIDDALRDFLACESLDYQRAVLSAFTKLAAIDADDAGQLAIHRQIGGDVSDVRRFGSPRAWYVHIREMTAAWIEQLDARAPKAYLQLYAPVKAGHTIADHVKIDVEALDKRLADEIGGASSFDGLTEAEMCVAAILREHRALIDALTPTLKDGQHYPLLWREMSQRVGVFVNGSGEHVATAAALVLIRDSHKPDQLRTYAAYPVLSSKSDVDLSGFQADELTTLRTLFGSHFAQRWTHYAPFGWRQSVAQYAHGRSTIALRATARLLRSLDDRVPDDLVFDDLFVETLRCGFRSFGVEDRYVEDIWNRLWVRDVADFLDRFADEVPENWTPERPPPFNNRIRAAQGLPRYV